MTILFHCLDDIPYKTGWGHLMWRRNNEIAMFSYFLTSWYWNKLCFVLLLSNITGVSQPLDQGNIKWLNLNYRELLLRSLIVDIKSASFATELAKPDAVICVAQKTEQLFPRTVHRCVQIAFSTDDLNDELSSTNCTWRLTHIQHRSLNDYETLTLHRHITRSENTIIV
jgi:hypothetical protein